MLAHPPSLLLLLPLWKTSSARPPLPSSQLVRAHPAAALAPAAFPPLCRAIGSWRVIGSEALRAQLGQLLHGIRAHLGPAAWAQGFGALEEPVRSKLAQQFGL